VLWVVLNTNVFVSSLLFKEALPAQVLDVWRERKFLLATSPTLVSEIQSTLNYPRIRILAVRELMEKLSAESQS